MATEVAFRSYIYTKVVTDDYQKVTGLLKAASLAGKLCSGIVSQLLVTFKIMDYMQLNYITLICKFSYPILMDTGNVKLKYFVAMLIMMVMSFKLPNVQHSVYFNKKSDATIPDENQTFIEKLHKASNMFRLHLSQFRTNRTLQKFSIFWIINLAMFLQMNTYMQSLWKDIVSDPTVPIYNGFVTAVYRILGIIVSLSVTCIRFDLKNKTFPLMLFFWLLQGSLLVVTSQVTNLISSYICYVSYAIIYQFLITILTSEIAKCIVNDSYGLVFSTNTFVALCLQLVLIHVFVKNHFSANFSIQMQYFLYGSVHFVLAFLIVIVVLIRCFSCNHHNVNNYNDTSDSSNEYNDFEAANKVLQETEIF